MDSTSNTQRNDVTVTMHFTHGSLHRPESVGVDEDAD